MGGSSTSAWAAPIRVIFSSMLCRIYRKNVEIVRWRTVKFSVAKSQRHSAHAKRMFCCNPRGFLTGASNNCVPRDPAWQIAPFHASRLHCQRKRKSFFSGRRTLFCGGVSACYRTALNLPEQLSNPIAKQIYFTYFERVKVARFRIAVDIVERARKSSCWLWPEVFTGYCWRRCPQPAVSFTSHFTISFGFRWSTHQIIGISLRRILISFYVRRSLCKQKFLF